MTSPPRAPVLAPPEVAGHAVEYARGPLRQSLLLFALLFLIFAGAAYFWGDVAAAALLTMLGLVLLAVGLWVYFMRPGMVSDGIPDTGEPRDADTHEPD